MNTRLAVLAAFLFLAPAANAAEVRFRFQGSVTNASNPNGAYTGVQNGDSAELVCEVDTTTANIVSPNQYVQYTVNTATMTLRLGSIVVPYTAGAPLVGMVNAFPVSDGVQDVNASMGAKGMAFNLNHNSGLWNSVDPLTNLGTHPIVLDGSFSFSFAIQGGGTFIEIMPSSIVVELVDVGTPYCFGDGSAAACPCGNASPVGAGVGCLNSMGLGGRLRAFGLASIAADSLSLGGSQMPNSSALYFQGTLQQGGGTGVAFGDGLRCAGGAVVRLGTKFNTSGASQYPVGADLSVSQRGLVTAPGSRTYQCWYRNAATFCTSSTFNLTNGVSISWMP